MTIAVALAVLVLTDCFLCGFRASAGREGRLDKRSYYREALLRALGWGFVVVAVNAALVAALVASSSTPDASWSAFVSAGEVCVWIFGTFATTVLATFAIYFVPVGELRVLASVIVFGPLTLARPWVIAGGLVAAVVLVPDLRVGAAATSAALSMLSFQRLLDRRYAERWRWLLDVAPVRGVPDSSTRTDRTA